MSRALRDGLRDQRHLVLGRHEGRADGPTIARGYLSGGFGEHSGSGSMPTASVTCQREGGNLATAATQVEETSGATQVESLDDVSASTRYCRRRRKSLTAGTAESDRRRPASRPGRRDCWW